MNSTFVQNVPSELICYICKDYFTGPFTLTCGHNFCTPCLCLLWEDAQHPPRCPVCRAVSPRTDFKSIIFAAKQVHVSNESVACQLPNSAKQVCRIHLVVKDLFCPTDKSPLCLHCANSQRHATHKHSPVSQAAEQCRIILLQEKLLLQKKSIWKSRQKNQKNLNKEYNLFRVWQDLGDIMKRSQLMQLHIPQPVNPQLSSWTITGMSERLNNFRVYLTLDRNISNYHVAPFEDLRYLQCSPDYQDMPHSPASPQYMPLWGAQTFTSGKHYWEVDVGNSRNWIVGLCKESWINRNGMLLNSEGIFLLLCIQMDDICHLFSASAPLRHYIQRPPGWIGVFLDYECGTISFVNVAQSSLICNLLSCSFSCPLRPFICYGPK
uniref:tripartite motif-containing protein 77 isoform X2 n=1 Tax=Halichoerus grypus TaxID=9711 RepID=UPI0016596BCB|nr:tripartite motif-containing protein 77 isoform X2 [Halichoerus grypus]